MNKNQKASSILGMAGAMITESKSGYREKYPENLSIFNANVCTKDEKIWWGDLDVTKSQNLLGDLAYILNEDIYVLYEMDARFENEEAPKIEKFAVKFFYDGGCELSKNLSKMYDPSIRLKSQYEEQ